ncbi:MAG: RNA polymerase sigma factor, partial [Chlorobi bacterium]|nr:RNA polymerase sigma factor [Chlorobiota bacterium]
NIDNFKGDSKLYSWMYRIATNEAITHINKNAKRLQITSEEVQNQVINNLKADVYFEGNDIQLKLQQAIATLPQKQQLVFNMKYFDNVKYKDMSEILETSEGALKSSYHIAVKKIEEYITRI